MANRQKNPLLMEDDPQDELLALRALKKANLANPIDVVRDGVEAMEYLFCEGSYATRNPADRPAVVLMDLKLPKLSGLEVLAKLRDQPATANQPVVVRASSDEDSDLLKSYQLGANSYVRKPVVFAKFSAAVAELGMYWLALNELPGNPE